MSQDTLLEKTKSFVADKLTKELDDKFIYHNLEHTEQVVAAAEEIIANSTLDDQEKEIVLLAAWLHDIGYTETNDNHEIKGAEIARAFLNEQGYSIREIEKVIKCIMATVMPQNPNNEMEKVLCDADLYHLSTSLYSERGNALRTEYESVKKEKFTDEKWWETNLNFFKGHSYFTAYGQTVLEKNKQKNLKALKKKYKDVGIDPKYVDKLEKEVVGLKNKLAKAKTIKPDRGIETMFRTTSKNHLDLSAMADTKANIMISINSILLSVVVTILMRKLENNPHLIIPTFALTFVCLVTIVIGILATRPNVSTGKFTPEDIMQKKTNLLFFGNFHGMALDDYLWGMKEMMKDADYLYSSMIKDIYYLGIVLGKKYRLLRLCYTIFMFGIVISVMLFVIAVLFFAPEGSEMETLF